MLPWIHLNGVSRNVWDRSRTRIGLEYSFNPGNDVRDILVDPVDFNNQPDPDRALEASALE